MFRRPGLVGPAGREGRSCCLVSQRSRPVRQSERDAVIIGVPLFSSPLTGTLSVLLWRYLACDGTGRCFVARVPWDLYEECNELRHPQLLALAKQSGRASSLASCFC